MTSATLPAADRRHISLADILDRLSTAINEETPKFALQRLLSDLVVHSTLEVRSQNPCPMADAEFLHYLHGLETGVAQSEIALAPAHLNRIRDWLENHGGTELQAAPPNF